MERPSPLARTLVLRYGWNATAYQILNPGIRHWFWHGGDGRGDAVVGYVRSWRRWVVAGSPICALDDLATVSAAFEAEAARHGACVCYFGADTRLHALRAGRPGYSEMLVGAQPVWDPAGWPEIVDHKASLRGQRNRARNKGVVVNEWAADRAHDHPALRRCLTEWLRTRGLPAMRFLVETQTLGRLLDRRVFVAERDGEAVAFLVASPIPARRGWLVEQLVRGDHAPNGAATLLLDAAMRALAADGSDYVTLGLSPLSQRAPADVENPLWLRALLGWVRAHGKRFYNFEGLERFKAKFVPNRWDPITALTNEPAPSLLTLYATADAFSGEGYSPFLFVGKALVDAVRQEARTLGGLRG